MRNWIRKRVDGAVLGSIALHMLLIVGGLISWSFSANTLPQESIPVDIVTASELTELMKGAKSGKQEDPKPRVDKVGEEKMNDDIGKVSPKPPVKTETAPPPQPKAAEKPPEPKVEPPKPPQPKQVEKAPTPPAKKADPIGDLAKEVAKQPPPKQPPKQEVKAAPKQQPKQERSFDDLMKSALIDRRDPTREANAGAAINPNSAIGAARGNAANNAGTWGAMFKQQVERCWKKPAGGIEAEKLEAVFNIRLKKDGTLEAPPSPTAENSNTPLARIVIESASRAIVECQPYNLPAAWFDEWKFFTPVFSYRENT